MKAIDNKELILALEELEKEKGIKKEYVLESIETALVTAYKRNYDSNADNVKVTMHPESGEIHVIAEMEVVETVEDDKTQINLEDAKKVNKNLEVGDTAQVEIIPRNFGRIAAQTAKQVIIQKIREASRNVLFDEFSERKGEIISGLVQKADGGIVVVDLGKLEGVRAHAAGDLHDAPQQLLTHQRAGGVVGVIDADHFRLGRDEALELIQVGEIVVFLL